MVRSSVRRHACTTYAAVVFLGLTAAVLVPVSPATADPPAPASESVAASDAARLGKHRVNSDVADVEALTPAGTSWRTYLHPEVAEEFGAPPLSQTPDEVLRAALEWSAQAGLTANPEAVREALAAHHVTAEDSFDELLAALGIG